MKVSGRHKDLPVVIATDSQYLKNFIHRGYFKNAFTANVTPTHFLGIGKGDLENVINLVAENGLLAYSSCFVRSASGYSTLAWLWGGHKCVYDMEPCMDENHAGLKT